MYLINCAKSYGATLAIILGLPIIYSQSICPIHYTNFVLHFTFHILYTDKCCYFLGTHLFVPFPTYFISFCRSIYLSNTLFCKSNLF